VRVGLGEGIVALAWITWRNSTLVYQYFDCGHSMAATVIAEAFETV